MPRHIAIVTGGGSGIGAAVAGRLAGEYDLLLTHLEPDGGLLRTVEQARARGADIETVTGDLTARGTLDEFRRVVLAHAARLEVLVCCAGAYPTVPWSELTLDEARYGLALNLTAHLACIQAVSPHLVSAGYGRIVAISSVIALVGRADLVPYAAAKGGLEALARSLARELGPHGVTVNIVRAGSIDVGPGKGTSGDTAAIERQLTAQSIKRRGQPQDVAAAVAFLASREAGFITGQCLTVDGGWSPS